MSRLPINLASDLGQAAQFHRREQVIGRRLPHLGLYRTHRYVRGETIDPSVFPASVSNLPITFHFRMLYGGSFFNVQVGSTTFGGGNQLAVGFSGGTAIGVAGDGTGDPDGSVFNAAAAVVTGGTYDVTLACVPGLGRAAMWIDGELVSIGQTTSGSYGPDGWNEGQGGLINDPGQYLISPVSVYVNQRPRQFPLDV